ncbi:MAG: hypothetical protein FRX49_12192 [Trebouxia sp. A1-2]|nr:MAG: hypothetical protein FRX49_12192 [Trebouxia sp. A1-2]
MESPGCTVPSRVRCTSFLLFSAAIALHHSSPTVNDVTATCLMSPDLAMLQIALPSKTEAPFLTSLDCRHSAARQLLDRDNPYILASSTLHFKREVRGNSRARASWGGGEGLVRSCLRRLSHLRRRVKSTTPRFCICNERGCCHLLATCCMKASGGNDHPLGVVPDLPGPLSGTAAVLQPGISVQRFEFLSTYGAHELKDEALHPLQLAGTVGCDGPCPHTPGACTPNTWLSLTKFQDASALKQAQPVGSWSGVAGAGVGAAALGWTP